MILIVDTHIHCYKHQDLVQIFSYTVENMDRRLNQLSYDSAEHAKILFFTNSNMDNSWAHIQHCAEQSAELNGWKIAAKNDLFEAQHQQLGTVVLAPAKQVNTSERLELLLLGCRTQEQDGQPAIDYIRQHSKDNLVICPWGVGKWLGKRSRILDELQMKYADRFWLGDNGGRPNLWFYIKQFRTAARLKQPIINGSDPLPIDSEIHRSGSFGAILEFEKESDEILFDTQSILSAIKEAKLNNYGSPMGILDFIKKRFQLSKA